MLNRFRENLVWDVFVLKISLIWKKISWLKLIKFEFDMYFLFFYIRYVFFIYIISFKLIKLIFWM